MERASQEPIHFDRIKQRKIVELIGLHNLQGVNDFGKLNSLCYDESATGSFRHHVKKFLVKDDILRVWDHYKTISPQEAWNGNMLSFGLLYSKNRQELSYCGDAYKGIEEGQIIFINIRLLGGLLNIPVAHCIAEIDESQNTIRICYLEKGATEGSQWIRFFKTNEGSTEIVHETLYKGKSKFRESTLYPILHEKAITEFHQNVERKLTQNIRL